MRKRPRRRRRLKGRVSCRPSTSASRWAWLLSLCLLALCTSGCRVPAPLPPVDVAQPGWRVRQGQALWRSDARGQAVAGELLLASGPRHACLVQFSKHPFALVTARREAEAWRVEFGAGARRWGGRGEPPDRWIWFHLPALENNRPAPASWRTGAGSDGAQFIEHAQTGERLEIWWSP